MSFFFSFLSSLVFLQIERERVYNWVQGETVLKFTYLYDDFPLENIFFFFRIDGIYSCILLWLEGMASTCPRYFPSSPGDFGGSFNISYHFNYCSANPGFVSSPGVWH